MGQFRFGDYVRIIEDDKRGIVIKANIDGPYIAVLFDDNSSMVYGYDQVEKVKSFIAGDPGDYDFKPFDRVLMRNREDEAWLPKHYAMTVYGNGRKILATSGEVFSYCLPYEGNEHLVDE